MIGEQPGWSALTGQSFDEYQGYGWADAIHPDDAQPTILAWNAAVAARRKFEFEHRVRRHDGQWRDFAIRAIPAIEADGSIREWIGVHTDITEQRTAERQLAAIASNLEERVRTATAELKNSQETLLQSQKLETIGQLTGGIAHDFNNLLTPIVGSLDFLRRRLENDERAQRLAAAGLQSADRAKTLVNRLLAFARRQTLDYQAVDIAELIEGMRDLIDRAIGPMIALHVDLPGDLPATLIDANQLELSILNLCVNARDAMAEGGSIWISAVAERVTALHPAGMAPGDYVRISVSDNGAGMDAETARRAIEPFYTTKEIGKGTGLGLSMVHGLTAQLGGGMTIDSRPGEGSRISLWLPAVFDSLPRPIAAAAPVSVAPSRSATVLLVDDEVLVRLATGEMLREAGYTVIEAGSGAEAREAVRAGLTPDILVSDQLMPGMKGNELATELREVFPSLRVLLATGYADLPDLKFPRIAKPYGAVELVERVRALVEDVRANP